MINFTQASERRDGWLRIAGALLIALISVAGFIFLAASEKAAADDTDSLTPADYLVRENVPGNVGPARLKYEGPQGTEVLENGGSLALADDVFLQVLVTPYPPSTFDVDVELRLTDANGQPIDHATITADWDMVFMWHGPFPARFDHIADGRYSTSLDLFMFGPWEVVTAVAIPGHEPFEDVSLSIYVWPE